MKKFNKFYGSSWIDKNKSSLFAAIVVLFTAISICFHKMWSSSSLIGGWVASFIISGLFYRFTIRPSLDHISDLIKPQIPVMIVNMLAKEKAGSIGSNLELTSNEASLNFVKAKAIKQVFTETSKCVDDYFSKYVELKESDNSSYSPSWLEFASFDSSISVQCKRKSEYEKLKEDFKKDIEIAIHKDLFEPLV